MFVRVEWGWLGWDTCSAACSTTDPQLGKLSNLNQSSFWNLSLEALGPPCLWLGILPKSTAGPSKTLSFGT